MVRGRPREFNADIALQKATLVFWKKGYRGTSLDDLTDAMSISRPSLYGAFGDKEQLFMAVIDHYRNTYMVPPVSKLLKAEQLRAGLGEFMTSIGDVVCGTDNPPGCLIACLLSEECCDSEVIRLKLENLIAGADEAFGALFKRHESELKPGLDPVSAGRLMTTTLHGLSIRARSGVPREQLVGIGKSFIDLMVS